MSKEVTPAEPAQANPEAAPADPAQAPKPEQPSEPQKPVEPAKPAEPEKFELKLPENSLLEPSAVDSITSFAKEHGLSAKQAQAVLESQHRMKESERSGYNEKVKGWKESLISDKDFGGEQAPKTAELSKAALERFGDKEFVEMLESSGLGNHPGLVKFAARIGRAMSEDRIVKPNTTTTRTRSIEESFYGKNE